MAFTGSAFTNYGRKFESVSLQVIYKCVEVLFETCLWSYHFRGKFTWGIMEVMVFEKVWI